MGEPVAAHGPSTFLSNGDSSLSSNEPSFRKLMMSNDSAASAAFLAKMFKTSNAFKSGDSAAFTSNIMKSSDLFNSEILMSVGMDRLFKSGEGMDHLFKSRETANMFKSSGDSTANIFKSEDMFSLFRSESSWSGESVNMSESGDSTDNNMFKSKDMSRLFKSTSSSAGGEASATVTRTDWRVLQEKKLTPALVGGGGVQVQPVRPRRPSSLRKKTGDVFVDDSEEKKPIPKRKRSRPIVEPEVKVHVEPMLDRDVLLGRGARTNHIVGNKMYLKAKDTLQDRYMLASRSGKTSIGQELVDIVKSRGGRFLKLDDEVHTCDKWYPVSNFVARKKASQTLREVNTPEERACKRSKYPKS